MKSRVILCTALAATLGFGSAAQARDWNNDPVRDGRERAERHDGKSRHQERQVQRQSRQIPQQYSQQNNTQNYQQSYQQSYPQNYAQQYGHTYQRNYVQPQQRSYNQYPQQYRSYYSPQYTSYSQAPRYWSGGYVPHQYRAQRYWVNDWQSRHLYAPPYGHQWVQMDTGDVLLMALATGLIASVILSQ